MIKRVFGKTGVSLSRLGFGAMRLPVFENGKIDRVKTGEMIDLAYRSGINYYDTAYGYHNGESEEVLGEALKKYPRESFYLADKMPMFFCKTEPDVERIFNDQLTRCGVDYFDFYLMHSLNTPIWDTAKKFAAMDKLIKKKAEGKIRHLGFSFHGDWNNFIEVLDAYDWEFVQLQLNYIDDIKTGSRKYYDELIKRQIPCIVMEPVRGGLLADLPPEALDAIGAKDNTHSAELAFRWLFGLANTPLILSGMSTLQQVEENLKIFDEEKPVSEPELAGLERARDVLAKLQAVPCTGCAYCENCPSGVDIPENMSLYNEYKIYRNDYGFQSGYDAIGDKASKSCTECGVCKPLCPQGIDIPFWMKAIAKEREGM